MATYTTSKEILENLDDAGFLFGEVILHMQEIVDCESSEFMDLLSEHLVGDDSLLDIDYSPLRIEGRNIVIGVYANPEMTLRDHEGRAFEDGGSLD